MPKKEKHKVKEYGTQTCPWCVRVKEFFDENNVEYEYVDVGKDRGAAMEMIEKTGQRGVPVIEIDGEIIVGFDEPRIREKLGLKSS
ncbi:MAG: NrdH-redoxin [Candidatus Aenigmarchaeota archaeon CG_4_10_14_0_8_um_filter_37_24]|nr:glutaredoxin family protein [Candidatus Aenigmarchaeota archaeon]OIN88604.1 MAG: NrdH-redoxin [Candidatus Aenigmarchaeota archaeon CG1_02_38_14]PIV67989.1 MAG: NrdH-redoxin [Candidatus Aenigmarchaeota archaeon CG01_land_8_20_14_3_00_37_9]PIW41657.1 MAG: NrdH-redoxin [Candidatus Aenigmarchaeota archaeon CG15_BIG_FIL_POST_REV_8_21_14_020_37_27]PIX50728.1 MAG: NrdH-redoxin [Candidatus Aenigmarchaeota archaeon CG_4_8_14_3_um_filter_37_24]PIY35793.1 MAG: NrdH-redoxin [Candidatus Aenigmarchaeota 